MGTLHGIINISLPWNAWKQIATLGMKFFLAVPKNKGQARLQKNESFSSDLFFIWVSTLEVVGNLNRHETNNTTHFWVKWYRWTCMLRMQRNLAINRFNETYYSLRSNYNTDTIKMILFIMWEQDYDSKVIPEQFGRTTRRVWLAPFNPGHRTEILPRVGRKRDFNIVVYIGSL